MPNEYEEPRYPAKFEILMTHEMRDEILPRLAGDFDMSKAAFIRWMIREYDSGRMLHLTQAMANFVDMIVEAGGRGLALLGAEAERTVMESDRWRIGGSRRPIGG